MRIKIAGWGVVFIFLLLGLGIFNLAVIQGRKFRNLSDRNSIRLFPQQGSRGRILDRQGKLLAGSYLSYDVMVVPQGEEDLNELFASLSRILGLSVKELQRSYREGVTGSSVPVVVASKIDIKKAIALEELKLDLGGVIIQPRPLRDYPYGRLACHVIGYLGQIDRWRLTKLEDYGYKTKDMVGFGGIEEKYDYYLRQEEGGFSVEVDHRGRTVRVLGFRPPRDGKDIQLTLDLGIQKIAQEVLVDRKGSVTLMSPHSGEVFAMASSPNFNPAVFISEGNAYGLMNIFNNPEAPLINRAISGVYPPASVFKLIIATAALELGKVNLSVTFPCDGGIYIGKRKFSCWNNHDRQNLIRAIIHSCDSFFYRTGILLGPEAIHNYALKFGLARPTGIELPYEESGFLPHPLWKKVYRLQKWFEGDTANFAIGQGDVLVTPLQLTRMMAVFANKGLLVNPYIVKAIDREETFGYHKKANRVPVKESTLNYIRGALRDTVADSSGTANVLAGLPVAVAGKTGSAQVSRGQAHGWFVGFFPFKNPQFVICVFLENGGSGTAAAVVTRQIIQGMIDQGLIENKG
jgi:penicillin-binding protein 2